MPQGVLTPATRLPGPGAGEVALVLQGQEEPSWERLWGPRTHLVLGAPHREVLFVQQTVCKTQADSQPERGGGGGGGARDERGATNTVGHGDRRSLRWDC